VLLVVGQRRREVEEVEDHKVLQRSTMALFVPIAEMKKSQGL